MKFDYQENANKSGIYKIINVHTNRIYIGQAKNFKKRWYDHKRHLLDRKHQNRFLKHDFNKCQLELGHTDFLEFHVLEVMEGSTKEERNSREEQIISEYYDKQELCYNFQQKVENKERSCYSNTPEETQLKKSAKSKKMWASPGFKDKNRKAIQDGTMKPESRVLRAQVMKEVWERPEHREKVVVHRQRPELKQAFMKNCHTPETIEKSRQARKRFYGSVISPTGITYEVWSLSEFCEEHKLGKNSIGNLGKVMSGKYKQVLGWKLAPSIAVP